MNKICKQIRCWSLLLVFFILVVAYFYSGTLNADEGPFYGAESIVVTTPTRGSHFRTVANKIQHGDTQWVSFTFHTGNVFSENPNAHLHVRLDSSEVPTDHPLRGRGIIIGDTSGASGCEEVAFELFSESNAHPGGCGFIGLGDDKEYDVSIHVSKGWVAYRIWEVSYVQPPQFGPPHPIPPIIRERELVAADATPMPDQELDAPMSGIAFGMAGDRNTSTFEISNIRYGVF